jgi:ribonuclease BN (tRNA processing enzyme)
MKLTVWGARGSIPVSGVEYNRYGGDTTCLELETDTGETVILDAGSGMRRLGNRMAAQNTSACTVILTHAHLDHLIGFPFFRPLYSAGVNIDVFGCRYAQQSARTMLSNTMRPPFFPVDLSEVAATLTFHEDNAEVFTAAGLQIRRIPLNHPNRGCGIVVQEGTRRLAFFPDNELGAVHHEGGLAAASYATLLNGVDLLVHDAEYTQDEYDAGRQGWGHSTYEQTVELAADAHAGRLLLWHLNQDRTDDQAEVILRSAQTRLTTLGAETTCSIAGTGFELTL